MNSGNRGLRDISSTDDLHEDRRHRSLHRFLRDKRKLKLRQKYTLLRSLRSGNLKRRLGKKRVVYERVGGLRTWGCQGWVDLHAVSRQEHMVAVSQESEEPSFSTEKHRGTTSISSRAILHRISAPLFTQKVPLNGSLSSCLSRVISSWTWPW